MTDAERRQRIEDLCHAALDHAEHERSTFLAAACEHDEVLLQDVENCSPIRGRRSGFSLHRSASSPRTS